MFCSCSGSFDVHRERVDIASRQRRQSISTVDAGSSPNVLVFDRRLAL